MESRWSGEALICFLFEVDTVVFFKADVKATFLQCHPTTDSVEESLLVQD